MLLTDGVRYELWSPPSEEDFEREVKMHAIDIFGEKCIYFDKKQKLKSLSGIGSIPDGLAIILNQPPEWHIVEFELSNHDVYGHIVSQVSKFINGLANLGTRQRIARVIYEGITEDPLQRLRVEQSSQSKEIFKFITDVVESKPALTIIIEKQTPELEEAIGAFSYPNVKNVKVVEFKTFTRTEVGLSVHAHLFEPLFSTSYEKILPTEKHVVREYSPRAPVQLAELRADQLDISLSNQSFIKFHLFYIPKGKRSFFPGYKIPFILETDVGTLQTHVTSAKAGTQIGDRNAGYYIQKGLTDWYKKHANLRVGDKVVLTVVEPMKRYRLEILK